MSSSCAMMPSLCYVKSVVINAFFTGYNAYSSISSIDAYSLCYAHSSVILVQQTGKLAVHE